jgi:hypothetical protein
VELNTGVPVKISAVEEPLASSEPLRAVPSVPQQVGFPRDSVAQLPWPQPDLPEPAEWEEFARFPNFWEGQILGGLLRNEGLPAVVEFQWPGVDLRSCSIVLVPRALMHRARWILSWPSPTEAELLFLATGEIGPPEEPESQVS